MKIASYTSPKAPFPLRSVPRRAADLRMRPALTSPGAGVPVGGNGILLIFAMALIVILMARPFDVVLVGLHIPLIVCGTAVLAVLFAGGIRGLSTRPGRFMAAYATWALLTSPFGIWKGGSIRYMENYVLLLVVLFLVSAEGPRSLKEVQRLMRIVGVSVGLSVVVLARLGQTASASPGAEDASGHAAQGARLGGLGMFGNEGEFALLIGFVIPFWIYTALSIRNKAIRLSMLAGSLYLLWLLLMTGTRSGLLSFVPVCLYLLLRLNMTKRVALIMGGVVFCLIVLVAAPGQVLQRLSRWTASDDSGNGTGLSESQKTEDIESAQDRKELFWDALTTTIQHPVFGVGAGNFGDYRATVLGPEQGKHKRWFPAHDTYMQIAAECGLPGLIIYLCLLWTIFTAIRGVRRRCGPGSPGYEQINAMTLCLQMSLLFYAVMSAFQNCDRYPHLFVIAGLAVALERITKAMPEGPRAATKSPLQLRNSAGSAALSGRPAGQIPALRRVPTW